MISNFSPKYGPGHFEERGAAPRSRGEATEELAGRQQQAEAGEVAGREDQENQGA